jgi:hypothetical protein
VKNAKKPKKGSKNAKKGKKMEFGTQQIMVLLGLLFQEQQAVLS